MQTERVCSYQEEEFFSLLVHVGVCICVELFEANGGVFCLFLIVDGKGKKGKDVEKKNMVSSGNLDMSAWGFGDDFDDPEPEYVALVLSLFITAISSVRPQKSNIS